MQRYSTQSSNPKWNAQRNLSGRTHYVDDDTLRFHKSRVLSARAVDDGLLFVIVTSDALNMNNTRRGFRFVVFDLFGNVISRTDLDHAYTSQQRALKAMWAELDKIDAKAVTFDAIKREERQHFEEMGELYKSLRKERAA